MFSEILIELVIKVSFLMLGDSCLIKFELFFCN